MYEEKDQDGRRRYTVAAIASEFGVTRPTIYRHLGRAGVTSDPDPFPARGIRRLS